MKYPGLILLSAVLLLAITGGCKKDPDEEEEPEEVELTFNESVYCDDSCYFSGDGECDDGGYGSTSTFCKFGTDCSDCGKRAVKKIQR